MSDRRSQSRERIYADLDERLTESEYDDIMAPTGAAHWEDRIEERTNCLPKTGRTESAQRDIEDA